MHIRVKSSRWRGLDDTCFEVSSFESIPRVILFVQCQNKIGGRQINRKRSVSEKCSQLCQRCSRQLQRLSVFLRLVLLSLLTIVYNAGITNIKSNDVHYTCTYCHERIYFPSSMLYGFWLLPQGNELLYFLNTIIVWIMYNTKNKFAGVVELLISSCIFTRWHWIVRKRNCSLNFQK